MNAYDRITKALKDWLNNHYRVNVSKISVDTKHFTCIMPRTSDYFSLPYINPLRPTSTEWVWRWDMESGSQKRLQRKSLRVCAEDSAKKPSSQKDLIFLSVVAGGFRYLKKIGRWHKQDKRDNNPTWSKPSH